MIWLAERQSVQERTDWRMDWRTDRPTVVLICVIKFAISDAWLARSVAFECGVRSQVCPIPNRTWDMKKQWLSKACYSRLGIALRRLKFFFLRLKVHFRFSNVWQACFQTMLKMRSIYVRIEILGLFCKHLFGSSIDCDLEIAFR